MRIKQFRSVLIALAASLASAPLAFAEMKQPRAVVELFTSQGCSSCPPADKVVNGYAKSDDVLALSWHVDYWDYIGWKDTFGSSENSDRQRAYAVSMQERGIYTPQAVINGRDHAVGSNKSDIDSMIERFVKTDQGLTVPIDIILKPHKISVTVDAAPEITGDASLWLIFIRKNAEVTIERGENRGKKVTYSNVVQKVQMLGMTEGGKLSIDLDRDMMNARGHDGYVFMLQSKTDRGTPGPILGAAMIDDINS